VEEERLLSSVRTESFEQLYYLAFLLWLRKYAHKISSAPSERQAGTRYTKNGRLIKIEKHDLLQRDDCYVMCVQLMGLRDNYEVLTMQG
jgi:hypothetical protein